MCSHCTSLGIALSVFTILINCANILIKICGVMLCKYCVMPIYLVTLFGQKALYPA